MMGCCMNSASRKPSTSPRLNASFAHGKTRCADGDHRASRPADHREERQLGNGLSRTLSGLRSLWVRRDAAGQHSEGGDVRHWGADLVVPGQVRRPGRSPKQAFDARVFETYPVLAVIALGWTLQDSRPAGRLPRYNPARRRTFSIVDWQHVCGRVTGAFQERGLSEIVDWIELYCPEDFAAKE